MQEIRFMSAVILLTADPAKLATFYRDALGVPLEHDQHAPGSAPPHFECQLGDVHFAIHPRESSDEDEKKPGRVKFAFAVFDLPTILERLRKYETRPLYPPVDRGFALMTAIIDPDGNQVELTQLSSRWLNYLSSRGANRRDLIVGLCENSA
jgi:predicted enzyme related to lactoylglutathione lyase